jgi:HAE1 family hydrophobic/amphiphilic exporter-1
MALVVSGRRSPREVTEITDKKIKQVLETVNGVGSVIFVGDRKREIQVSADTNRLAAYNLSIDDVKQALQRQNVEIPGGRITFGQREEGLRTLGRMMRVEDFNDLIVTTRRGYAVRVSDIGRVEDSAEEPRTLARYDGQNAVSLLIRKQSGTNTIEVVDRVKKRLGSIQANLPADMKVEVVRDSSKFIRRSLFEVQEHLLLGGLLASLVVLFFIRNFRAAFIAALAIPTSIIGTFTLIRYMGFTLNNMTFLALSLSTGIVIDDAIVVLENIFRYIEEEGFDPIDAARYATKEIGLAVMATTISLVVIFLPVAFMSGIVGRFFYSFGITISTAILLSLFVSFTLTPMMSSRLLKRVKPGQEPGNSSAHQKSVSKESKTYAVIEHSYDQMLRWSLAHRKMVVLIAALVVLSIVPAFIWVKKEFVPDDDMSEFEIILEMPAGSSLERSDAITRTLEGEIKQLPGVTHLFTTIGVQGAQISNVTNADIYVALTPIKQRQHSQQEIMRMTRQVMAKYKELRPSVQQVPLISGGGFRSQPYNLNITGPDLETLNNYAYELIRRLAATPGFVDTDTALINRQPETQVHINRKKAADLGVNVTAIAGSLRTLVGGEKVTTYREGDDQYNVRLRLRQDYRKDAQVIYQVNVPSANNRLVKLSNLATLSSGTSPGQIDHYNRNRSMTVISNLDPDVLPLGTAMMKTSVYLKAMNLAPGYTTFYSGRGKTYIEAMQNFLIALILSLFFIYMVLAAQFESLIHPLTIMLSLPLSLPFGLITLALVGKSLNLYSVLGIFMLMGVVKKNAILQVDYTNTLRKRGLERYDAIIQANRARLRPILMTTAAIVAGMLPIAFGKGDGSASRASMATLVVGGQSLCLLLTLLVTPVAYTIWDDLGQRAWFRRLAESRFFMWPREKLARLAGLVVSILPFRK